MDHAYKWCGHQQAVSSVLMAETRQIHMDYESCGGKGMARPLSQGESSSLLGAPRPHSQEESTPTLALSGSYWLNLHRNTGHIWKVHQSLSVNNSQIDNIQRTLRANFESGPDSWRTIKLWGNKFILCFGPLSFKLRVLTKQVSQNFMHSFSGLITPGNLPFLAKGCTHLQHCFRLRVKQGN